MRKLLSNKIYLMLISVLIAFVMWVSVVSISNPDTTGSKAVTVEERNASAITSAGKAYTIQGSKTVKVNYTVQARDAYKVKSSDFRAYVDLSDIYDATGSVRVVVQAVNNQDIISECSCTPQTLQVIVEDIITKTVSVKVYTVDSCPPGYEAAASTTALTQVEITGPESLINSIAVAGVEVSVKDAAGTLSGNAPLKFYDSDDVSARAVDVENNKYFSASEYSTDYTLFINAVKNVPIQYEISGTPASGYSCTGSTASVESIEIKGNADVVGQISAITIPSSDLNVDGATSKKSWNIDLNTYLPSGVTATGTHQTEITALIESDGTSSDGPGVTVQTEAATTANHTEGTTGSSSAESSGAGQAAGGPGVDVTKAETEAVPEKEAETQSGTQSENVAETSSGAHSQTESSDESQSQEQSGTHIETRSQEQESSNAESQAQEQRSHAEGQTQEQDGSQNEVQAGSEAQSEAQSEVQGGEQSGNLSHEQGQN